MSLVCRPVGLRDGQGLAICHGGGGQGYDGVWTFQFGVAVLQYGMERDIEMGQAGRPQADDQFSQKPMFQYRTLRNMGILNQNLSD